MTSTLRYHPNFDSDVLDAANWYDERQALLGDDFVLRVRNAIDQIRSDPQRRSAVDHGIRYWPVGRFPFIVFYDLSETEILILGVMHTAEDAGKWISRRKFPGEK